MLDLKELDKNSPFNKHYYSVNINLNRVIPGLMMYINDEVKEEHPDIILEQGIPTFQRDNDKWTAGMQRKFVENCLLGHRTEILLFELDKSLSRMWILDGLQRLTALIKFIKGDLEVFEGWTYEVMLKEFKGMLSANSFIMKAYTFNNEKEAVEFYISMNEGITHSSKDILRAKEYLKEVTDAQKNQ